MFEVAKDKVADSRDYGLRETTVVLTHPYFSAYIMDGRSNRGSNSNPKCCPYLHTHVTTTDTAKSMRI